jgi:hypothetical protein
VIAALTANQQMASPRIDSTALDFFLPPFCFAAGTPQCGHAVASVLTLPEHSEHLTMAIGIMDRPAMAGGFTQSSRGEMEPLRVVKPRAWSASNQRRN